MPQEQHFLDKSEHSRTSKEVDSTDENAYQCIAALGKPSRPRSHLRCSSGRKHAPAVDHLDSWIITYLFSTIIDDTSDLPSLRIIKG